jgi:hypothetical protein
VSVTALAPEATAGLRAAQASLEQEAARLASINDPVAPMIGVFAEAAKAQHRLAVDSSLKGQKQQEAVAQLIQDGRKPWSRDEMRALVMQLDQTLLYRWTQFNRAGIAIGVAVTMLFGGISGVAGWWFGGRPYVQVPAQLAAALKGPDAAMWINLIRLNDIGKTERVCETQGGGTACAISLWTKPPTARR